MSVRKSAPLRKDSVCQDKGRVNKCYVTTRGFLSSVEWRVQFWKSAVKRKHTEGSSFFDHKDKIGSLLVDVVTFNAPYTKSQEL